MNYTQNRVSQILGIKYPIVQAPMNWITNAELVAAVSNAGGLGVLGPNAGQSTPTTSIDETVERMRSEIRKTRSLTTAPFGLNLVITTPADAPIDAVVKGLLEMALEEGVRHFATVGTAHKDVFQQIKAHQGIIMHRPLEPSVQAMQEAERLGADLLVATGSEEGGLIPQRQWGTFTVVPTMVDAVQVPVLGAGGINDARGVKAMFALGAEGVYVGTRFAATRECPSVDAVKQLIVDSGYEDILDVSPNQRSLATPAAARISALYRNPASGIDANTELRKLGGMRPAMLLGEMDKGTISTNLGIDLIHDIPSVAELIRRLMEE